MSNSRYLPFIRFSFSNLVKSKNRKSRSVKKARLTYFKIKFQATSKAELKEETSETSYSMKLFGSERLLLPSSFLGQMFLF